MPESIITPAIATVITDAILRSPTIIRLGLACPSDRLRERAAADLAEEIIAKLAAMLTN